MAGAGHASGAFDAVRAPRGNSARDRHHANGHGRAVAVCDDDGGLRAVGDEPNTSRSSRRARRMAGGSKGGGAFPSPAQCSTLGKLAHQPQTTTMICFRVVVFFFVGCSFSIW